MPAQPLREDPLPLCPVTGVVLLKGSIKRLENYTWAYTIQDPYFTGKGPGYINFVVEPAAFGEQNLPKNEGYWGWDDDDWYKRNQHSLFDAFKNGVRLFHNNESGPTNPITLLQVKQRFGLTTIPQTHEAKLNGLLKYINSQQLSAGSTVALQKYLSSLSQLYLKDEAEFMFYINTLQKKGFIEVDLTTANWPATITFDGLEYLNSLEQKGPTSKNCFLAMSFSEARQPFGQIILSVIEATGYTPIIVNREHVNNDQTINDRIIAGIRESKFCIADFTEQRNGVYFEAGFALGLGRPVIYISDKDDFDKNSHFDLKPFQHILYSTEDELRQQLEAKIRAWIV